MLNPLYLLGPPTLILVSIPLAIFAIITTSVAFSTLLVRVSIVYFELGLALIHSYLFVPPPTSPKSKPPSVSPLSQRGSPQRARHRRSSASSNQTSTSIETAVPAHGPPYKSGSFASLSNGSGIERDFEGVGGWRMSGEEDEEALWIGMNSRLELPAVLPATPANPLRKKNHQRSLTGGSQRWSYSPEVFRMSPVQSRAWTPISLAERRSGRNSPEDYFGNNGMSNRLSTASDPTGKTTRHERRKSGGSASSSGSSRRASIIMQSALAEE